MIHILHICSYADCNEALKRGEYRADSLDTEGFIHCSTPAQVVKTANRFYRGRQDLILLVIDPNRVTPEIRAEAADADVFPHIYGPLNLDAVVRTRDFVPTSQDGSFQLPKLENEAEN